MTKLEKVIKGLQRCCVDNCTQGSKCPYYSEEDCVTTLLYDALELLKEQEPRVLTLEEVKDFNWDYCYLEEDRLPGKGYRAVCGDYALTCITWPCVASMRIQYGDESYGKDWRCWSARPTDEQREAVKWDADISR